MCFNSAKVIITIDPLDITSHQLVKEKSRLSHLLSSPPLYLRCTIQAIYSQNKLVGFEIVLASVMTKEQEAMLTAIIESFTLQIV
jgi:hypothetical protein